MKKITLFLVCSLFMSTVYGQVGGTINPVLQKISDMGYDIRNYIELENYYLIDGDLVFSKNINDYNLGNTKTHFTMDDLVSDDNITITIYSYLEDEDVDVTLNDGTTGSQTLDWGQALQAAVNDWNQVRDPSCNPLFEIIPQSNVAQGEFADIKILGPDQAGPINDNIFGYVIGEPYCGKPYKEVWINTDFRYGSNQQDLPTADNMRNIIGHELGHAIGFWHTDDGVGNPIPGTGGTDDDSLMHGDIVERTMTGLTPTDAVAFGYVYSCSSQVNDNASHSGLVVITDTNTVDFCDNGTFTVKGIYETCNNEPSVDIELCFEQVDAVGTSVCSHLTRDTFYNGEFEFNNIDTSLIPNYIPGTNYLVTAKLISSDPDNSLPHILNLNCTVGTLCLPYPKEIIRNGDKQNPYLVKVDNNDDILLMNINENTTVDLEGETITAPYFIAKYNQDGCLLWTRPITDGYSELIIDDNNNAYKLSYWTWNQPFPYLEKYSSSGSPSGELNIPSVRSWIGMTLSGSLGYISGENSNDFRTRIFQVETENMTSYQEISTGLPQTNVSISSVYVSNDMNNLFAVIATGPYAGYTNTSPFQFGSSTITPPTYDPAFPNNYPKNYYILKYSFDASTNTITPVNAVQTNTWSNNIYYHKNSNGFLINNSGTLTYLDQNLIQQGATVNTLSSTYTNMNQRLNSYSVISNSGSSVTMDIIDIPSLQITSRSLTIPNIENIYARINHDRDSSEDLYISWVTSGSWNMNFQKLDPTTGDLIARSSVPDNTKENLQELQTETLIYPNPFSNSILIKKEATMKISQVIIYDRLGNTIITEKATKKEAISEINTASLSKGIYFLKTILTDGTSTVKQIVKN